jgi:hypothetical protein
MAVWVELPAADCTVIHDDHGLARGTGSAADASPGDDVYPK